MHHPTTMPALGISSAWIPGGAGYLLQGQLAASLLCSSRGMAAGKGATSCFKGRAQLTPPKNNQEAPKTGSTHKGHTGAQRSPKAVPCLHNEEQMAS